MYYCNRNLSQSFTFAKSGGFHYSYRQMAKRKPAEQHPALKIEYWPIDRLQPYERNPRRNDKAVGQMVASIREYGFTIPVLAKSDGLVIDGHLRLKAAVQMKLAEVPVIPCDTWTEAQVKAFRLMVNRLGLRPVTEERVPSHAEACRAGAPSTKKQQQGRGYSARPVRRIRLDADRLRVDGQGGQIDGDRPWIL